MARLHDDQIDVSDALVRTLIDTQFPHWSHLRLQRMPSDGTINRVDALGDDLVVRTPFIAWGAADVDRDEALLPLMRDALPVAVPALVASGSPAPGMPWRWGVYRRLAGRHPVPGTSDDAVVGTGLADVVVALRALPAAGEPSPAVFDFAADDAQTRPKVDALGPAAVAVWEAAIAAKPSTADHAWIHGDLMPGNVLLSGDPVAVTAVLDWAAAGVGDAAFDLLPAWTVMSGAARREFLDAVGATPDQIARGRGYAVRKVAWGLPYYRETLPGFAASMAHTLREIESDVALA